jgi:hypothetical protein
MLGVEVGSAERAGLVVFFEPPLSTLRGITEAGLLCLDQEIRPAIGYTLLLSAWRTRQFIWLSTHKVSGCFRTARWLQLWIALGRQPTQLPTHFAFGLNGSGRSVGGNSRRRPAWENGPCFVFSNITANGVDSGYQNANKTRGRFGWCANGGFLEGAG